MAFILILIGGFGIALIGYVSYTYYNSDSMLAKGISLYETGDEEHAIETFKNYTATKPKDVRGRWYLAKLYVKKEEYVFALKECISITINKYSTMHEKAEAYALMAEIYIGQDLMDKAVKVASEGIKLEPKNPSLHYQLGILYLKTEKSAKALREFNIVLTVDRMHIQTRLMLSEIHHREGDDTRAIFQYRKVLEIQPINKEARYKLAKIYYEKGDIAAAVKELEELKDIQGIELDYYYIIADYYLKIKNREKAKENLEKIAFVSEDKDDKIIFIRYELAVIYEEEGNLEKAFELYTKIKAFLPRYKDIDSRIQKLKKILYPEEHAMLVSKVDYNNLSNIEFEELFGRIINKLGYKEMKVFQKSRNTITMVVVEKFKNALNGKVMIKILKSFEPVGDLEVVKFDETIKDENFDKGIFVTTSTFSPSAKNLGDTMEHLQLMDKADVFELLT